MMERSRVGITFIVVGVLGLVFLGQAGVIAFLGSQQLPPLPSAPES